MVRGIEGCKVFRNDIDRDNFLEGTEIWDVLQNINPKNIKDQPDKNFRYLAHWNEYLFVM
jgi:hypothetical protein